NALYDYRIKSIASDSSLNSGWGSYQFKTLLGTPIGSASSITASSATISWNAITDAVGYSFQYKLRTANNWSTIININTSDRSISLDNLNDNAIYDYRVMADASSPSQNSGWGLGEFYTLLRTPVCRIDSITSSSAFISWNEVNGAIGFVWQIKLKSSSQWSAENNVDISLRSINILNLEDNSIYDLRIRSLSYNSNSSERQNVSNGSINDNVNSEWGYYEIQTLLTTPNNISVNNYTNTSVNLIWDNVNNADSYTIQYKEKGTSSWNPLNSTINSQLITGLNHLKEYEAQVNANSTSPANNSEWSAIIEFKPILATPILNVITNITTNNATINWNAINDAGSYDIEYQIDGGTEWTSGGNPTTLSQTLSSLQQGTYYKVRVKAKAISPNTNHSDWSNESSFTTICPKVTNINIPITYADSTSAMVNWTAGGTETSWLLKYKALPSGEWSNEITVNTTPEYRLTNLLAGTMYQVSISTPCQDATSIETTEEFVTSTTNLIIRDNFTLDLVSKIVNQSNSNLNIIFRVSASPFDGSTLGQSIGNGTNPFSGRIIFVDDSGNEIENGSVIINNLTTPLFGVVVETNIHNITLTNVNITSSSQSTGGLINDAIGTIIRNCSVNGNITGENNTGGLIGNTDEASIDSSSFSGTVNGIDMVGGLVGNHNNCSVIKNSSASVNVIGQTKVGGLVGFSNCYVGNSHATGNISAINMAGGLVGYCNGVIRKSYSTCQIIRSFGNDNLFGGLVGSGFGNEDKSFYQTPVSFGVYNFRGKQSNNPANEPDLQ
ncbi:MAG: fibronectin type III domain-containing protein, partial [Bacteroidales bacterium]